MFRSLILAVPLLAVGIAPLLAQPPEVPQADLYKQQQSRAIAIQNWSSQSIVSAQVQTTPDGKTWQLGHGTDIARNQANEIIVPAKDCIAKITVQLKDGNKLSANGLNACRHADCGARRRGGDRPASGAWGEYALGPSDREDFEPFLSYPGQNLFA